MSPCGVFDWGDKIVGESTLSFAPAGDGSRDPAREFERDGFREGIREPGRVVGRSVACVRTSRLTEFERPRVVRCGVDSSRAGVDWDDDDGCCLRWNEAIDCFTPSAKGSAIKSRGATLPRA